MIGIAGSGKTKTLSELTMDLTEVGHKLLICAPNNATLNNDAIAVYQARPAECKAKFLRLETLGVETASISQFADVDEETNPNRPMGSRTQTTVPSETLSYRTALTECLMEEDYATKEKKLKELREHGVAYQEAIEAMSVQVSSDVPAAMTMQWRMWDLLRRYDIQAEQDYQADIANAQQHGVSPPEITKMCRDGQIKSPSDRSLATEYRLYLQEYLDKDGRLSSTSRNKFRLLREMMISRVLRETDVLFITLNNAGSELANGFEATVALIDEIAQASVPASLVPLTVFSKLQGVYWVGDPRQLRPTVMSSRTNEVVDNSKTSPLELILSRPGCPLIVLNTQYRMCPAISNIVRRFYPEGLEDHHTAITDNDIRQKVRATSKQFYGNKSPEGSEIIVVNVERGISRVEKGGNSLQNYANVDAMQEALQRCMAAGISPTQITILTPYRGQKMLAQSHNLDGSCKEIATVDSYQGKENHIIFLDYVTARRFLRHHSNNEDDELDFSSLTEEEYKNVTAHLKDIHRNCVALTRAMYGLIIFCQLIQFHSGDEKSDKSVLGGLMKDFMVKGLVYHDKTHVDTHPMAQEERARNKTSAEQHEEVQEDKARSLFYRKMLQQQHAGPAPNTPQAKSRQPQLKPKGKGSEPGPRPKSGTLSTGLPPRPPTTGPPPRATHPQASRIPQRPPGPPPPRGPP